MISGELVTEGLEYLIPSGDPYESATSDKLEIKPFTVNFNSSQTPHEGNDLGFGFMGKVSEAYSLALLASINNLGAEEFHLGRVDNQGGGTDWYKLLTNDLSVPIPGYLKVNGGVIDCSLVNGSTTMVSLAKSVPTNSICFIEADIITSVVGGSVKTSAALMFFRYASGDTVCDINSRAIGGTQQGQVKLNVATINSSSAFVIVTTAYNLDSSVSGGVIRIKAMYAKI